MTLRSRSTWTLYGAPLLLVAACFAMALAVAPPPGSRPLTATARSFALQIFTQTCSRSIVRGSFANASACTDMSARLLNLKDYGFAVGNPADVVVIGAQEPEQVIAEISQPLAVFKNGKRTVVWHPPQLLRPHHVLDLQH